MSFSPAFKSLFVQPRLVCRMPVVFVLQKHFDGRGAGIIKLQADYGAESDFVFATEREAVISRNSAADMAAAVVEPAARATSPTIGNFIELVTVSTADRARED